MAVGRWSPDVLRAVCALCFASPVPGACQVGAPDFSPDQHRVAAVCGSLHVVDLQSRAVKTVPGAAPEQPQNPAGAVSWSPDGGRLVFAGPAAAGAGEARLYDVASAKATRLAGTGTGPFAWREDGRRFASFASRADGVTAVWYDVVDRGVALRTRLPATPSDAIWLPGTDDVAVLASRGGNASDIYMIESGEVHQVTKTGDVIGFALAPDKQKLIWARRSANPRYILISLYEMDLKARSVRRLGFPDRVVGINPDPRHGPTAVSRVAFSPDGSRLAIVVGMGASPEPGTGAARTVPSCYVVSRDGTGARLVRRGQAVPGGGESYVPAWSRDGKLLALASCTGGEGSLRLYDAPGSGERILIGR